MVSDVSCSEMVRLMRDEVAWLPRWNGCGISCYALPVEVYHASGLNYGLS